MPATCIVGAMTWDIEKVILEAQKDEPDPGTGPQGRLFVPKFVKGQVLRWTHNSKLTCHPGFTRMLTFTQTFGGL